MYSICQRYKMGVCAMLTCHANVSGLDCSLHRMERVALFWLYWNCERLCKLLRTFFFKTYT